MEPIKDFSCGLASSLGEQRDRTFSHSTADGINYVTNGVIEDNNSDIAHGVMFIAGASLVGGIATKNATWIVLFIVLIILILIFWSAGQNPSAIRKRPSNLYCP